jgi:hypothetical protein
VLLVDGLRTRLIAAADSGAPTAHASGDDNVEGGREDQDCNDEACSLASSASQQHIRHVAQHVAGVILPPSQVVQVKSMANPSPEESFESTDVSEPDAASAPKRPASPVKPFTETPAAPHVQEPRPREPDQGISNNAAGVLTVAATLLVGAALIRRRLNGA